MQDVRREEGLACGGASVYSSCRSGRSRSVCFSLLNFGSSFHREKI